MDNGLRLQNVKLLAVLRNSLSGELGVVMSISGDRLDLKDRTGAVARYKFGKHFSLAEHDEAVDFRALVRAASKKQSENGKKKRPRSITAFLNKLAKKR